MFFFLSGFHSTPSGSEDLSLFRSFTLYRLTAEKVLRWWSNLLVTCLCNQPSRQSPSELRRSVSWWFYCVYTFVFLCPTLRITVSILLAQLLTFYWKNALHKTEKKTRSGLFFCCSLEFKRRGDKRTGLLKGRKWQRVFEAAIVLSQHAVHCEPLTVISGHDKTVMRKVSFCPLWLLLLHHLRLYFLIPDLRRFVLLYKMTYILLQLIKCWHLTPNFDISGFQIGLRLKKGTCRRICHLDQGSQTTAHGPDIYFYNLAVQDP